MSRAAERDLIEAFNGLAEVVDFLVVLDMAFASEERAKPFDSLATVSAATLTRARAAHEATRRALDLCKATA